MHITHARVSANELNANVSVERFETRHVWLNRLKRRVVSEGVMVETEIAQDFGEGSLRLLPTTSHCPTTDRPPPVTVLHRQTTTSHCPTTDRPPPVTVLRQTDFDVTIGQYEVSDRNLAFLILVELTLHADSYSLSVAPDLVLPQWRVKDLGHSVKSACGRLQLNTHTPLTQRNRSRLTMPLSRHSGGTYPETARTQLVREHSSTVVSARWATVD